MKNNARKSKVCIIYLIKKHSIIMISYADRLVYFLGSTLNTSEIVKKHCNFNKNGLCGLPLIVIILKDLGVHKFWTRFTYHPHMRWFLDSW